MLAEPAPTIQPGGRGPTGGSSGVAIVSGREKGKLDHATVTGAQLLALGGIPAGDQLFLDQPGNGDDDPISPAQSLTVRSGMEFYDVRVGNLR